jgi:stage II sporulation protein AA (anti-sigma F factor antagonist)
MLQGLEISDSSINVSLVGELDLKTSDGLRNKLDHLLDKYPDKELVLDFKDLSFIDSSGLGLILGRYKRVSKQGRRMSIINAHSSAKRILELSGITALIPVSSANYG